ncbi:MAG: hypothetical protein M3O99_10705, partial [Chloroflexota bacterium]|nr:hypothetical protein [Chloroflexota bacterium]
MGLSFEELLFLHDRLRLSRSGRLRGASRLLRGARGSLGDARGVGDADRLGGRGASYLLSRETRVLGTARVFLLAQRRQPLVFITALLVATLFLFPPLGRASLLLLAPLRGAPLLFVTPLLFEARGIRGAGLVRGLARVFSGASPGDG